MPAIYVITNSLTRRCYIGQALDPDARWKSHLKAMRGGVKTKLYDAMRSYGIHCFVMRVVEFCTRQELNKCESKWIASFDALKSGYNMISDSTHGRTISEETRIRMSEAQKGKTLLESTRVKIGLSLTGKTRINSKKGWKHKFPRSQETIIKMKEAASFRSDGWRRKQSLAQTGRVKTQEERLKMSSVLKGIPKSKEHKIAISLARIGCRLSDEMKMQRKNKMLEKTKS